MNNITFTFDFNNQNSYDGFSNRYSFEDPVNLNWIAHNFNCEVDNDKNDEKSSTYAEEGSVDLANIETLETSDPVALQKLEKNVKKEITEKGLDFALELCLKTKNSEKKKVHKKIRNKQTKSKDQLIRLQEELKKNPHRWNKQERIRIGEEIGLTQIQVYKWYYDNTWAKAMLAKKSETSTELSGDNSPKRAKLEENEEIAERPHFE